MNPETRDGLLKACRQGPQEVLLQAYQCDASDLHWIPEAEAYSLKIRIGGALLHIGRIGLSEGRRIVQAFKAAGQMNIAESRKPQDARVQFQTVQARLSTHPCIHGESLVLRILARQVTQKLKDLGFSPQSLSRISQLIHYDAGLTLVSGPTGSGKTTTLHGMLYTLGEAAGQIVTLEDPVEIVNHSARQTDLSTLPHLTFSMGLKSLMRQDPDTILVGEIRDTDTAQLTLNAALTGHRVLASVHAPDCLGTLARLVEFGLPLKTLLISLNGLICQRLNTGTHKGVWAEVMSIAPLPRAEVLGIESLRDLHQVCVKNQAMWSFSEDWNAFN
ncbi:MAG: ATPase, T2SS/T4P/T4SS family [Limnobacter sp.]|nr:ATPase, T2SS/T4P/T4SS family [Limnobacter sp.]